MKVFVPLTALIIVFFACKSKPSEAALVKYYVLIDGVQKVDTGLQDVQLIDTVFCNSDTMAIDQGLAKYYDRVAQIEIQATGPEPAIPYLTTARGWAVLDERGDNVKHRVRQSYVDSSNTKALERAQSRINLIRQQ